MSKCEQCGKSSKHGMIILSDSTSERHLCRNCHNNLLADTLGIENFKDYIRTYQSKDLDGKMHVFEIEKQIFFYGIKWLANEIKNGEVQGYQFGLYADLDDNPMESLQKLYSKIKKGLSKKYIKKAGHGFFSLPGDKFAGRIEWDEENNGEVPRLVIDGKIYSWHQVGRMLMAYEGWTVELKVTELGEE
ncbi:MAG: DUF7713 domain-containing protein [Mobilitalea sp.]